MLASFRNLRQFQSIVVCGSGGLLAAVDRPDRFITIGVNDGGHLFHPDYLVVIYGREPLHDRFCYVETSQARWIFTQRIKFGATHPHIANVRLVSGDGTDSRVAETLPFSRERLVIPHAAVCLALHSGAQNIGLVGVDLTDHHCRANTGAHEWAPPLATKDRGFARLGVAVLERGWRIFNLSETSCLSGFPKMSLDAIASIDPIPSRSTASKRPLRIVSYARTPLVGRPALMMRGIDAQAPRRARRVCATDRYQTGVFFAQDVNWTTAAAGAEPEIEAVTSMLQNARAGERHRAHRGQVRRNASRSPRERHLWCISRWLSYRVRDYSLTPIEAIAACRHTVSQGTEGE